MAGTWFIVASASGARICEWAPGQGYLLEIARVIDPPSRGMRRGLSSDLDGHVQRSTGVGDEGGVALPRYTDARHPTGAVLAHQLADYVEETLAASWSDELWLLAAHPFLGELRSHLREAGKHALRTVTPSDLSGLGLPELAEHLRALEL